MGNEPPQNTDLQTQPSMMTLKQFLVTQDDSISDSDAIEKYNEYKLEFKRLQLNEFFVAHKDEEWYVSRLIDKCGLLSLPPVNRRNDVKEISICGI